MGKIKSTLPNEFDEAMEDIYRSMDCEINILHDRLQSVQDGLSLIRSLIGKEDARAIQLVEDLERRLRTVQNGR